jgi:membrane protein YdbS with pleckstrin-like domain
MGYAESLLAKDEQILYEGRQHWLAPLSDSLKPILLVLLAAVLFFVQIQAHLVDIFSTIWTALWAILLLVGIVWIAIVLLTWRMQEYAITNRRVLKVEGLLDKKSGDSSLDKINDAVLKQGLLARLLKYGDLDILTANEEAIDRYVMLAHAVDFKKAMLNAKNNLEDGGRGFAPPAATAKGGSGKATSTDDVTATLSKLADLRDKGAITQADYDAKKTDLLGRI